MDTSTKPRNPSSMRVLIRPPQPPLTSSSSSSNPVDRSKPRLSQPFSRPSVSSPSPPLPPPPNPSQLNGVVVVGFIGRREGDVAQLINRVVDSDAFGSGNRWKSLPIEGEELRDWFESRAIGYYHDEEKGILYLQMCSTKCPAVSSQRMAGNPDFDSPVEEHEFGDLQGMLFMFTVCHVIVYILDGSNFDVEVLRRLRVLQSSKNALSPLMRSRNSTSSLSKPPLSSSHASPTVILSKNASPGRGGGVSVHSPSAISVMSGLGLYTSLFPGQCTPVTLFIFVDDFSDMTNSSTSVEDTAEASSALSSLGRSALHTKGSGSVVVLARPVNKFEGGSRKKLQSALEGQIRFLIKKCRALSGSEHSHSGSRGGLSSSSAPLLTLDASRAVVLLDRSSNQRGVSLDYACGLIEDVLNGKATPDSLLLERHSQSGNKEDITAVKDFIFRQAHILRGRGGMVTNANSGSAAGVGMVAVAAAAAAVSAASGKSATAPELPSLDVWVSSSQIILKGIFSAKHVSIEEHDLRRRKYRQRNGVPPQAEGADPLDIAVSLLESGKGMNTKFSTVWCQRVLPAAMDVYMEDLPASYPTSQHEAHLEKALRFYHSMVKGPSVLQFMKKLEDDCISIWKSGRQLCDAVSLTGKPCMHQKHDNDEKQHCSGYVFLHACACGRSRRIRADPFNFEVANEFNRFEDCDNLLPVHKLPKVSDNESTQKGAWIIVKVGGSKYYDPYRGLLQSGFCANQKFLMKWTIVLDKDKQLNDSFVQCFWQGALSSVAADSNSDFPADTNSVKKTGFLMHPGEKQTGNETQTLAVDNVKPDDKKISFGNGLPNITMKKPFSEVVAGSPANSAFPPLQSKKQSSVGPDKGPKNSSRDLTAEKFNIDQKRYSKTEESTSAVENINGVNPLGSVDTNPCVQIGNNVIQLNINDGSKSKFNPSLKHIIVYVGFEHECPHGHRFILSTEHLNELGFPYSSPEDSNIPSSMDNLDKRHQEPSNVGQSGSYNKGLGRLHGSMNVEKSREFGVHQNDPHLVGPLKSLKSGKKQGQMSIGVSKIPDSARHFQSVKLDDGGQAFSLLNRNLPVYINCPHCRVHKNKKDRRSAKFAGTISQLQRIFVVTPPFPVVLSTNPVVQFEGSCQALDALKYEKQLQFSFGCQVVLPPESFVSIRLPFIYGIHLEHKGDVHPLKPFEPQPELTAWLKKGTALSVMSKGTVPDQLLHENK